MTDKAMRRLHAVVHGRVQGVNFRAYTIRQADDLGLCGWVRNVRNGTVETVAEGEQGQLNSFLAFLQVGPPSAIVSQVEADWQAATGEFTEFRVRYESW
jgi:acylphosphatase